MAADNEDIEAMSNELSRKTAQVRDLQETVNQLEQYYEQAEIFSSRIGELLGHPREERNVAFQIEVQGGNSNTTERAAQAENDENAAGIEQETPEITRAVLRLLLDERNGELEALEQRRTVGERIAEMATTFYFERRRFLEGVGGRVEERDPAEVQLENEQNEPLPNDVLENP